jgi:hypothetical protein
MVVLLIAQLKKVIHARAAQQATKMFAFKYAEMVFKLLMKSVMMQISKTLMDAPQLARRNLDLHA